MVGGLLDTSIVIDLLRLHGPAQNWLQQQGSLGVSPIVWLEILQGSQNKSSQKSAIALLNTFEQVDLAPEDSSWAIEQAVRFTLSHNVEAFDCLIAATSYRLGIPLFTTNLKHFSPLLNTLAQKPY